MAERNRRRGNDSQRDTAEDDLKQRLVKENEALKQARLSKQERINKIKSDLETIPLDILLGTEKKAYITLGE